MKMDVHYILRNSIIKKRIDLSRAEMLCIICIKKVEAEIRKMNNFMNGESFFQKKLIKKVKKKI